MPQPNERLFSIDYKCPNCEHEWKEEWQSACDSECPECHTKNIEASEWEDVSDYNSEDMTALIEAAHAIIKAQGFPQIGEAFKKLADAAAQFPEA